jgi:hypothetical protein
MNRALGLLATIFVFALIASGDPINTITVGPGSTVVDGTPFSVAFSLPSVSGSLVEWVVSDTTNGPGDLDFIFQVTVSSGSLKSFAMTSCCGAGFAGGITTGYGSPGTETPSSFGTIVSGLDETSGPEFTFGSGMTVGTSVDLILQSSTGLDHTALLNINGTPDPEVITVLGPLPEPKSIGLVLGGCFALGLFLMRQFRTQ